MEKERLEAIANAHLESLNERILVEIKSNVPGRGLVGVTKTGEEISLNYVGPDALFCVENEHIKRSEETRVDLAYKALRRIIAELHNTYFHLGLTAISLDRTEIPYTQFIKRED